VKHDRPAGEPMSAGRNGTPVVSARDVMFVVALFVTAVLINGILAIALIEILEAIGVWEATSGARQR